MPFLDENIPVMPPLFAREVFEWNCVWDGTARKCRFTTVGMETRLLRMKSQTSKKRLWGSECFLSAPAVGKLRPRPLTLIFHVGFLSLGYDPTALGLPDMALERKTKRREK